MGSKEFKERFVGSFNEFEWRFKRILVGFRGISGAVI